MARDVVGCQQHIVLQCNQHGKADTRRPAIALVWTPQPAGLSLPYTGPIDTRIEYLIPSDIGPGVERPVITGMSADVSANATSSVTNITAFARGS